MLTPNVAHGQLPSCTGQSFTAAARTRPPSTPPAAIAAATRNAAGILGLDELGTVAEGKSADFLVLDANPLDAIGKTRAISKVYMRGAEIDRAALKARWSAR